MKPSAFIGSSTEGLPIARAVRDLLLNDAEIKIWDEGFFTLGSTFIERLCSALPSFDFAILILTADDMVTSRGLEMFGPRDNVIFELGLFMAHLGRMRTYIVHEAEKVKIPSDLAGVATASYVAPQTDGDVKAVVDSACTKIREAIRMQGIAEQKMKLQLQAVEREQRRQKDVIETLSFLVTHFLTGYEIAHLQKLATGDPFLYDWAWTFEQELRHLVALNFIEKTHHFRISQMPHHDDLKKYFRIHDRGRLYLQLKDKADRQQL